MLNVIHLDPSMVPQHLRGSYSGKKFKAEVCQQVSIPSDAGLWSGGTRENYFAIDFDTGQSKPFPNQHVAPWDGARQSYTVELKPGLAVVCHSMFCGKDMGLTFYVHPENATKMLPAPVELDDVERLVLKATRSFKASHNGRDRYQMMLAETRWGPKENAAFPTRAQWDEAKARLITKGFLNKAGAITVKGRNAAAD